MADLIGVMEGRGIWRWPKSLNHPPQEMPYWKWVLHMKEQACMFCRREGFGAWPYIEILKIDKRPEIDMRGLALWSNR